jgi:hypothetical protein
MAGKNKKRDYKKEYRDYHGKPSQVKNRQKRNEARKKMGLKKGDSREVDHKKPLIRIICGRYQEKQTEKRDQNKSLA